MAKLTTKRALICLLFLVIVLVALYSFLLDRKGTNVRLQDGVLRSESGRLVVRSQFDFHHIMEQWIQPDGKKNHSTRRKERLIEDGHVIKEAFDYGESENEKVDDFQQNKHNFHLKQLTNISSRHKSNKQLLQELGLAHSKPIVFQRVPDQFPTGARFLKSRANLRGFGVKILAEFCFKNRCFRS